MYCQYLSILHSCKKLNNSCKFRSDLKFCNLEASDDFVHYVWHLFEVPKLSLLNTIRTLADIPFREKVF